MRPIFEFTLDNRTYSCFANGNVIASDAVVTNNLIINYAQPILYLLQALAIKHNDEDVMRICNDYFPNDLPRFRVATVKNKNGEMVEVDIVDGLDPLPLKPDEPFPFIGSEKIS